MVFWILVIIVTAIACAALYYAAIRRPVNAAAPRGPDATATHFKLQLKEIEADIASGRLGEAEALAARGELARELLRFEGEKPGVQGDASRRDWLLPLSVLLVAVVALGSYSLLGSPELPSLPLATRTDSASTGITLEEAVGHIEAQLEATPEDLRGWSVVAPAYKQLGRFADAARAYRRVIDLEGPSAERETDLGEALMLATGSAEGEPMALFRSAAARDERHVRSRFYLASEATRLGNYEEAVQLWNEILALAEGDEAWVAAARQGLSVASAGLNGDSLPDEETIGGMVESLAARLAAEGGTIAEWTRLVRSRLVLGQIDAAQADYDAARRAYPDAAGRAELDVLAADNGLQATEANN